MISIEKGPRAVFSGVGDADPLIAMFPNKDKPGKFGGSIIYHFDEDPGFVCESVDGHYWFTLR